MADAHSRTRPNCHPERSEGPLLMALRVPHFVRDDTDVGLCDSEPMMEEELQAALEEATPERERYELFVEECQDQDVRVRFSPAKGEGWTMPALLAVAHLSLRAAAGAR